jgi:anaerobic selenocysteine-containing dehydrogenase
MTIDQLRAYPTGRTYDAKGFKQEYETYEKAFRKKSSALSGGAYLPQGKVAIYSTTFERHGFSPLPVWREPPESLTGNPDLNEKYPLILSDYHTSDVYSAAWLRNVPNLRELHPDPVLHIHPEAAAARNIRTGDWVRVESPHGWIKVKAELYPGIRPDTVMVLHGWWQGCRELGREDLPLLDGGANVNLMYSVDPEKAYDPLITAMSSQTLVEVRKYE